MRGVASLARARNIRLWSFGGVVDIGRVFDIGGLVDIARVVDIGRAVDIGRVLDIGRVADFYSQLEVITRSRSRRYQQ